MFSALFRIQVKVFENFVYLHFLIPYVVNLLVMNSQAIQYVWKLFIRKKQYSNYLFNVNKVYHRTYVLIVHHTLIRYLIM